MSKQKTSDMQLQHKEAMNLAEQGLIAKLANDSDRYNLLIAQAFQLEKEVALSQKDNITFEPSRSVLFRSAASLAFQANLYDEAEKLIHQALSGNPPSEIRLELYDILKELLFKRELKAQEEQYSDDQVNLRFEGPKIGYGFAPINIIIKKLENFKKLFYRTVQRLNDFEFDLDKKTINNIHKVYPIFLSATMAGSYSVNLRFGAVENQLQLPFEITPTEIIEDISTNISLVGEDNYENLSKNIKDQKFLNNFIHLSKNIAPDGKNINNVELTTKYRGKSKIINLSRTSKEIDKLTKHQSSSPNVEKITIIGELQAAQKVKSNEITVVDEENNSHKIVVAEELIDDIVRPHWGEKVAVTVSMKGKRKEFNEIERCED